MRSKFNFFRRSNFWSWDRNSICSWDRICPIILIRRSTLWSWDRKSKPKVSISNFMRLKFIFHEIEFMRSNFFVSHKNDHEIETLKTIISNFDLMKKGLIRKSNQLLGISISWKVPKNSISWIRSHEKTNFDLMKFDLLTLSHIVL